MEKDTNKIDIRIEYDQHISLTDLTLCLINFSSQYSKYLIREHGVSVADAKDPLFVDHIKEGSVLIKLVGNTLPFLADINTTIQFLGYFKTLLEQLASNKPVPAHLTKKDMQEIAELVKPCAQGTINNFNISCGDLHIRINQDGGEKIRNNIANIGRSEKNIEHKQLLSIYQVRLDSADKKGDKGIIEDILKDPVNIIFDNDDLKKAIIDRKIDGKTWQDQLLYLVDVEVLHAFGAIKGYKIIAYHHNDTLNLNTG